jgi:predicted PurR-regulated permease PerM
VSFLVTYNPDPTQLPFNGTLSDMANGLGGTALILCVVALVLAAAIWALGHFAGNYRAERVGMFSFAAVFIAAVLVAGAGIVVNFAQGVGSHLH